MTKDEHQSLAVIARMIPDSIFVKDASQQCAPFACSRQKGHTGIHILMDPRHPISDENLYKLLRGDDV
jgi:hypothetical protein